MSPNPEIIRTRNDLRELIRDFADGRFADCLVVDDRTETAQTVIDPKDRRDGPKK